MADQKLIGRHHVPFYLKFILLHQWFSTFMVERNPNKTLRGLRNPSALI